VLPEQDVMRLDNEGRMNRPGRAEGNWAWRVGPPSIWKSLSKEAASLKAMAEVCTSIVIERAVCTISDGKVLASASTRFCKAVTWTHMGSGVAILGRAMQVYDRLPPREMEVAAEGPKKP
jgi:hypothetical protein